MSGEVLQAIGLLAEGRNLPHDMAARVFHIVMQGGATPAQMAALLLGLRVKGETHAELAGALAAMQAKMEKITAPPGTMDVCGTGGDGLGTLNISTAVALVVASCGVPVAKHGNRSVSSRSGSADVLGALGVNVQAGPAQAQALLAETNFCFLFAPLYHKAMRHVVPVRQELGIRTLFNLLGPLANPARPTRQLVGVYAPEWLEPVAALLHGIGVTDAWVVHGSDGLDEISLTGSTAAIRLHHGHTEPFEITPEMAGLPRCTLGDIRGGDAQHNALALRRLLDGIPSPYRDMVALNAAAALVIAGKAETLRAGALQAIAAIEDGHAQAMLLSVIQGSAA